MLFPHHSSHVSAPTGNNGGNINKIPVAATIGAVGLLIAPYVSDLHSLSVTALHVVQSSVWCN